MKYLDPKVQIARECHLWRQEVGNFIQQPQFGGGMAKPPNYVKNYLRLLLQLRTLYLKFSKHELLSLRNTR